MQYWKGQLGFDLYVVEPDPVDEDDWDKCIVNLGWKGLGRDWISTVGDQCEVFGIATD